MGGKTTILGVAATWSHIRSGHASAAVPLFPVPTSVMVNIVVVAAAADATIVVVVKEKEVVAAAVEEEK